MASKKCPKCGEDNPAEAVMCWACYTPLSGAPAMAVPGMTGAPGMASGAGTATRAGAPGSPIGVPAGADDGSSKKNIDPKIIGAGAFLVVAGLVGFLISSSMGGSTEDVVAGTNPEIAPPTQPFIAPPPPPTNIGVPPAPGQAPPAVAVIPFTLVTPPNPKFATGTAGVVATGRNLSPAQAGGVARFARNQLARGGKWSSMQVLVFADQQTAQAFSAFQNKRQGSPLQGSDYQSLAGQGIWAGTIAYLDVRGKTERVYYPSTNPNSWWGSIGR